MKKKKKSLLKIMEKKPIIYKELGKSKICKEVMVKGYNKVINEGKIPIKWLNSRTKLIKKCNKPKAKDHRPIAVTNIDYKILMSFLKKKIENHLQINGLDIDNQIGFRDGGRTEFNHFILQYMVERAHIREEEMYVIAIDFKKAFDSVNRIKLIEALIEFKIHPKIVDLIANLYSGDKTTLTLGKMSREVNVNSGIKQGCPLSTTIFKLVTYMIIKELDRNGKNMMWMEKMLVHFSLLMIACFLLRIKKMLNLI